MSSNIINCPKIAVIGLGYVGLPLAFRLSRNFSVIGFDVNEDRINKLNKGIDSTNEYNRTALKEKQFDITHQEKKIKDCNVYIIAVPTPVDSQNVPELGSILSASETVGRTLTKGNIVVFESTVYPGVTETICGPAIEKASGLKCGKNFFLGYSPERINPGDWGHTIDKIAKIIAGQTPAVTSVLERIYSTVTTEKIFKAKNIKTAEAAKVIENAQRDINIAFINEVAMIFSKMDIKIHDVLAAAQTKWNFLDFKPGLVGGHCIGVDPYYLAHAARHAGHNPEVILAGRRINDGFAIFIAIS